MQKRAKKYGTRIAALIMSLALFVSSMYAVTALAAQEDNYHDPAEHWLTSSNRTSELDMNAVLTHETFLCRQCGKNTSFIVWRTPEYTKDGATALSRNVMYSDGTLLNGVGTGSLASGMPGVNAYYTGYHWNKSCCESCGTLNSNESVSAYNFGKNVYNLYSCAAEFTQTLPEDVSYEYADSTYHRKTVIGGSYCGFCFGTHKTTASTLQRHSLNHKVIPQIANQRFLIKDTCELCDYERTAYIEAKSVVADYYGIADGLPHTLTVSDLSEAGVVTRIRYGNSADACTMTNAPSFIEAGQYTVYYEITYAYGGENMTENGVAYVWLYDDKNTEDCPCGCGKPDCDCQDKNCDGSCHGGCSEHNFIVVETVNPTCKTLGYTRYVCVNCGKSEKRDYVNALDHAWQSVLIREADCENGGKTLNICANCKEFSETITEKGEHEYETYSVSANCTSPGYTVKECAVCGDRHITDIKPASAHEYRPIINPASCENGGYTLHLCHGCGSSFITDYTDSLGHSFDKGTAVTSPSCTGEGVTEYRCERCGYHYLSAVSTKGHTPDHEADCTEPSTCTVCGAILKLALGHKESGWITDREPTTENEGERHKECENCGKTLQTETLEKIYTSAVTDNRGEAVIGGYIITVSDTNTHEPVIHAAVKLNENGSISVQLPDNRLIAYENQTTITVMLKAEKKPVSSIDIFVTDRNDNYSYGVTDSAGQITVPNTAGKTNADGKLTGGVEDGNGNRKTVTVKVEHYDTGRPIENADISIDKNGDVSVRLPDGIDMDKNNKITITVTDTEKQAMKDVSVRVENDLGNVEKGKTDKNGKLTVPAASVNVSSGSSGGGGGYTVVRPAVKKISHSAYIEGYTDGTFRPERSMTRAEAAAIFARLLSEKKNDKLTLGSVNATAYDDVPATAWYAGYVKYLDKCGVIYGRSEKKFAPNEPITRAEFTAMSVRFFNAYGGSADEDKYAVFNDIALGYWAYDYIRAAAAHGWVDGYGDGTFRAERYITRAEVVTLVNRLLERSADTAYVARNIRSLNSFTDVSDKHWAYTDVMEAANTHLTTVGKTEAWSK